MNNPNPIVSLCLPTNGIAEWVFPVLDSIYSQNVETGLFEVIVTNNGDNSEFHEKMTKYASEHDNIVYKKTDAFMFHNQLEALKLASGDYLKFLNHRSILLEDSLKEIIRIVIENADKKPVMYFANGELGEEIFHLQSFDLFVRTLGRLASWTTGVGIWREDYQRLPNDLRIDKISPHSCILFSERHKNEYTIYNFKFSDEIEKSHEKKGKYDLFKAFGVEELSITQNLYIDGDITAETFKCVKKDYKKMVSDLYFQFCIKKDPCSYILTGFDDAMGFYFNKTEVLLEAYWIMIKKIMRRVLKK